MSEFFHAHPVWVFATLCVTIGLATHYVSLWNDRRRVFPADPSKVDWQCVAYHGAGNAWTPEPLTESDAVDWCSEHLGAVAYIDREHHKIFYRARSAQG